MKQQHVTGLLVSSKDYGTGSTRVLCHAIKLEGTDRLVRNFSTSWGDEELPLADLTIEALVNAEHADLGASYGWSIDYSDVYHVDLRRADAMAKLLKTIGKRMDKSSAQYGRPATFGAFVAHAARAIGATTIVFERKHGRGNSYDDNDYGYSSIADGTSEIDAMVGRLLPDKATVAA